MSGPRSPTPTSRVRIRLEGGATMCVSPDLADKLRRNSQVIDAGNAANLMTHVCEHTAENPAIFGQRFSFGESVTQGISTSPPPGGKTVTGTSRKARKNSGRAQRPRVSSASAVQGNTCTTSEWKVLDKQEKTKLNEKEKPVKGEPVTRKSRTQVKERPASVWYDDRTPEADSDVTRAPVTRQFSDTGSYTKKKRSRLNSLKAHLVEPILNKIRPGSPREADGQYGETPKRKSILRHSLSEESILDVSGNDDESLVPSGGRHRKKRVKSSQPILLNMNKLNEDGSRIPNGHFTNGLPRADSVDCLLDGNYSTLASSGKSPSSPCLAVPEGSSSISGSPIPSSPQPAMVPELRISINSSSKPPVPPISQRRVRSPKCQQSPSPPITRRPRVSDSAYDSLPTSPRTPKVPSPKHDLGNYSWDSGGGWCYDEKFDSNVCEQLDNRLYLPDMAHISNGPVLMPATMTDTSMTNGSISGPEMSSSSNPGTLANAIVGCEQLDGANQCVPPRRSPVPQRKWSSTIVPILEARESLELSEEAAHQSLALTGQGSQLDNDTENLRNQTTQEFSTPLKFVVGHANPSDESKSEDSSSDIISSESDVRSSQNNGEIKTVQRPSSSQDAKLSNVMLMRQGSEISTTSSEGSRSLPRSSRFEKQRRKSVKTDVVLKSGVKKKLSDTRLDVGFIPQEDIPEVVISGPEGRDPTPQGGRLHRTTMDTCPGGSQDHQSGQSDQDKREVKYKFCDEVLVIQSREDSTSDLSDNGVCDGHRERAGRTRRRGRGHGWDNYVDGNVLWGPSPGSPRTGKAWINHRSATDLTAKPEATKDNEDNLSCQNPACETGLPSSKVCHHGDCLERNAGLPLILCTGCDTSVHSSPESEGHLRFDLEHTSHDVSSDQSPVVAIQRRGSSQSLPEAGFLPETSTSDTEVEIGSRQDQGDDWVDGDIVRNTKLQRKKVLRVRRHNTENEQRILAKMMSSTHRRSRSYQEFSTLDLSGRNLRDPEATSSGPDLRASSSLNHGDSGVVMTSDGVPQPRADTKKRVFSVDSLPLRVDMPSQAYLYSDKRNMPVLDTPSPGFLSPAQTSPGVFILPGLEHCDTPTETPDPGSQGPTYQRKRSDTKRPKVDMITPPHLFMRKHSMPAMLSGGSGSNSHGDRKVNLGNVECFQIHFNIVEELIKGQDVEIVPAIKGVSLREAVSSYIEKRGLTFDMVDFFISSSQSPLQVDTADCYYLAGADLHVKAKQSGDPAFNRQTFGSTKSTVSTRSADKRPLHSKGSRSDLNVTESNSPHVLRGTQPLKGIGKLFGVSTKKPDQLQEMLQYYRNNGLPPMPDLLQLGRDKFDPSIFELESNWTEIVSDTKNCDRYQQEAIWELLKTEVAYIRDLQFVINLFLACLYNLQSQALLNDVETEKIFSNISDLHQANCAFYKKHMYTVVTTARETGQPLDPTPLIQGFNQFRTYFEPYSKFCIEYMGCQLYLSRMKEENELFRMFLNWTENQPECNRLSLRDYIGKPFQRLTKYKLLLERIWKSSRPDNVQDMISKVDQFICKVNATVTQLEIMRRIDSYDAVELPNNDALTKMVGPFCRLDLTRPIPGSTRTRFLVDEGTLRMNSRTDVICFLFTDMLLITKSNKKLDINNKAKVKVYKPPMRLDKIYVNPLADGGFMLVYLNEYNLATTAYTFHGDHARQWLDRIRQTQDEYEKLRNAIMDQSEAYLLNLANGFEQYEDEYAYMNARSVAMEMGLDRVSVNRQVSVSSADTFMGNFPERGGHDRGRPRSMAGSDFDRLRARSGLSHVTDRDQSPKDSPPATPLVTSYPSNGATLNARFQSPQEQFHLSSGDTNSVTGTPDSKSHRAPIQQTYSSPVCMSQQEAATHSHVLPPRLSGDDMRKIRQRRDRRYFTADMIQDLHHNPASIQKRLSWHCGTKETDYEYRQQGMGKLRTVSSDSLRSGVSSSGVSSVGSLQNPDHEISEESDYIPGDLSSEESSQASDITTKTRISSAEQGDYPLSVGLDNDDTPGDKTSRHHVSFVGDNNNSVIISNLSSQSKVSKSMPDISKLTVCEQDGEEQGRDRASTIDLIREGQRRKLSDSQSKRLKLQILNSTLEATDV